MKTAKRLSTTLFFLIMCILKMEAQSIKNYEKEWNNVEELLQKKNLPKSALAEVKKIYALAKRDKQEAQVIKALVYTISLQQENREEATVSAIKEIEKEITLSKEPAVSILKSIEADLYWNYFQQNRYKLYNRTNTVNFIKEDIATWTPEDFHKKISSLYLQSISKDAILKETKLEPFDAIITKGNVRHLRPTLYDLLAQKALPYFKNDERDLAKPAYTFQVDSPEAFAPATLFVKAKFSTNDSLSLKHKALLIYQDLIQFHLSDAKPDALIDADIDRIQFVKGASVLPEKDALYKQALENLTSAYSNHPAVAQAQFLLAAYYENLATRYEPLKDTTYRFDRVKAKEILEKVVRDSSIKNEGWANSYNLLKGINQPYFSFEVEKVNIPGQPFRALVKYKNIASLYFRIVKADASLKDGLKYHTDEKYWNNLTSAAQLKAWQQTLPQTGDWQQHSTEVKIEELPAGEYILLASPDAQFDKKANPLGAQLFYVSNISYVSRNQQFFVLNRESGQPLNGATVKVYQQLYDYKTYKYTRAAFGTFKTDKNGYFKINDKKEPQRNGYLLDITYHEDRLNLDDLIYDYYSSENRDEDDEEKKIFFFTDRAIYRPGQTVYFKGIAVTKNKTIATGYKTTIFLENANNEEADSLNVTTNEFGSFSGKFTLPQNILNGEFRIYDKEDNNSISFSVE
jgi:hypothetical protein